MTKQYRRPRQYGRPDRTKLSKTVALATVSPSPPPVVRLELEDQARNFAAEVRSRRTRTSYAYEWKRFAAWCADRSLRALPCEPGTLGLFVTDRASTVKPASIAVMLAAIVAVHEAAGVQEHMLPNRDPLFGAIWRGIRRVKGCAPRRVAAVAVVDLALMSETLSADTLIGQRDRAVLVCGFAGAFRRSELSALNIENITFTKAGVVAHVAHSKTDQLREGCDVGLGFGSVPLTCPVRTLRAWIDALEAAGIAEGALFRSINRHGQLGDRLDSQSVARIVKRTVKAIGLDPALYAGHSLRSGLATAAAKAGKSDRSIMQQGRWSGRGMVDRYVRSATLLDSQNASIGIGL